MGLSTHGDTGTAWHRDACCAPARAVLVNLGPCTFELDRGRDSANGRPLDPVSLQPSGGEVLDFDCKHQYRSSGIPGGRSPRPASPERDRCPLLTEYIFSYT